MEVADRNEHPFISICDLHDQLLLNVEKVEIFIFGTYLLTAYKSRFTFLGSNYIYDLSLSWLDTGTSITSS